MSQNKTRVPGVDGNDYDAPYTQSDEEARPNQSSPYARQSVHGTVFPGMEAAMPSNVDASRQPQPSGKPVVGFLYSVSSGRPEYWPIHIGVNIIGSEEGGCDVVLDEQTVSAHHAELTVRRYDGEEVQPMQAWISDSRSTNGTVVNGRGLMRNEVDLQSGDIIRFGINYEMVIILVDAGALGLKRAAKFSRRAPQAEAASSPNYGYPDDDGPRFTRDEEIFGPSNNPYSASTGGQGGTVLTDGNSLSQGRGKTEYM
ncbi:MAG: FHA domain-containing protein [Muribaculaceae bacterium]|nr:FHA domain-containing protein [Muribaculaceae bacterium]